MDIDLVKEKKNEAENKIREIIVKFGEETGLVIEDIRFEMIDISEIGGPRKMSCTSVQMDVRLG